MSLDALGLTGIYPSVTGNLGAYIWWSGGKPHTGETNPYSSRYSKPKLDMSTWTCGAPIRDMGVKNLGEDFLKIFDTGKPFQGIISG